MQSGELDIALVGLTGTDVGADIGIDIVLDTPLVVAVAPDGERRGAIPLAELREHPLICLSRGGTGIRGVFDRACTAAGFEPDIAFEAAAPPLLLRLAARGLGIAVVPALTAEEASAFGVRALPIIEPELRGQLALAWRRDRPGSPAAKVLLGQLRISLGGS